MSRGSSNVISSPWFPLLLVAGGLMGSYATHVAMYVPIERLLIFVLSWTAGATIAWMFIKRTYGGKR